jgi:hypothetical protein
LISKKSVLRLKGRYEKLTDDGRQVMAKAHIAKDKALRLITNQSVLTPQAIGIWLRRLGKDNQGIKALLISIFGLGELNIFIEKWIECCLDKYKGFTWHTQ